MTLRRFREERIEGGEGLDAEEWGGCACMEGDDQLSLFEGVCSE